jgi:natural product biosynthesis luciferase-like monooxygenase protein
MNERKGKTISCALIGDESLLIQCGELLRERGHAIVATITGSDAVADWARSHGLPVLPPGKNLEQDLAPYTYDWFFSIANLRMIPAPIWKRAHVGAANFHDGPLPRFAGLNCPAWAILGGETEYGVTWHALSEGIDEGDIYANSSFEIGEEETALSLNAKCFAAGISSFAELLEKIERGTLSGEPQAFDQRTYFARHQRPYAAATIDFTKTTAEIVRLARGLEFGDRYTNPLAMPKIRTAGGTYAAIGVEAEPITETHPAGTVISAAEDGAIIATADGAVRIASLRDASGIRITPCRALKAGDVLPALESAEADRLMEFATELAKSESFFVSRLKNARAPDVSGLTPAGTGDAPVGMLSLARPAQWSAEETAQAIACFFARTGNQSRFTLSFSDDRLASESAALAGYLAPTVPLTLTVAADTTIAGLSETVAAELEQAKTRRGYSCDLVGRIPGVAPPVGGVALRIAENAAANLAVAGSALTFAIVSGSPDIPVHVDTSRLSRDNAEALLRQMAATFAALAGSERPTLISDLPVMSRDEVNALILDRNRTERDYDRDALVHQLIERQAKITPDATALISGAQMLTYRELDQSADRIAATLAARGVGADKLVGLYINRSCDLVVAALAILKAGGAYVPLDPTYPPDRIALMIEDSGLSIILTDEGLTPPIGSAKVEVLTVDQAARASEAQASPPSSDATPGNLAYVIYTSGSTGRPKGVMVEHRNVVNFFAGMNDRIPRSDGVQPVWLAVTSLSFDISVLELFWTLAHGFAVVVNSSRQRPAVSPRRRAAGSKPMDFSLYFWGNDDGAGPRKYQLLLDGARFADAHDFRAVWTPERHFHAFGGPYPNPSVTGAAVAAVTSNLDIRAGSCVVPLHHPARVAEEWAVIDNISNGRAGIAFASGWMPEDFLLRPENAPPNNKTAMLRDVETVRKLWRGEAVSFPAPNGKQVDVITQPRPVSRDLPVWVTTAGNPDTYREAARLGANVLTHLLGQSIDEVADKIRIYRETLKETGRNPADYTVTLMLHTLIGQDREEVRDIAREPMKNYLRSAAALIKQYAWAFPAFKKPQGVSNPMDIDLQSLDPEEFDAIIEFAFLRYFDDSGLFGTVDDALNRVDQLTAIGVDEIACLIDFGVKTEIALEALKPLADVVAAARAPAIEAAADAEEDATLAALIRRHGVTHMQCTPSMAAMALMSADDREALKSVRHLFIGGEALQPALINDLRSVTDATIENMYGPTETTIWSSTGPASARGEGAVPLGKPIANTQLYIFDDMQRLVPKGVAGELCIGGDGVTRGYLGRPDLTAERFLQNPFVDGGRIYRTGDLVRIGEDSEIHFLGRADHQVKVRGFRIELGEIEARIGLHPDVAEAVVVAREDDPNDVRIVAYVRYKGAAVSEADVRTHVQGALPDFMVPAHFVTVQSFPLTPNAKVDRKALPRPEEAMRAKPAAEYVAPANDLQIKISEAFRKLLGIERVGVSDNFFTLGGHSLLAVQLHRDLKANVSQTLTITDVYRFPTVAGLAAHIQDRGQASKHLASVADRAAARRQAMLGRRGVGR